MQQTADWSRTQSITTRHKHVLVQRSSTGGTQRYCRGVATFLVKTIFFLGFKKKKKKLNINRATRLKALVGVEALVGFFSLVFHFSSFLWLKIGPKCQNKPAHIWVGHGTRSMAVLMDPSCIQGSRLPVTSVPTWWQCPLPVTKGTASWLIQLHCLNWRGRVSTGGRWRACSLRDSDWTVPRWKEETKRPKLTTSFFNSIKHPPLRLFRQRHIFYSFPTEWFNINSKKQEGPQQLETNWSLYWNVARH